MNAHQITWQGARQRKAAQLKRDGINLIVIFGIAALIVAALLLTGCTTATVNLCDPSVSFIQVTDTSFDAYSNGAIIAHNVTFDMIAAACGGK